MTSAPTSRRTPAADPGRVDRPHLRARRQARRRLDYGRWRPRCVRRGREKIEAAWKEAGREGEPRRLSIAYFALGPNAEAEAEHDLKHYYAWLGDEIAGAVAGGAATDEDTVRAYVQSFEQAGCDELILFPTSADAEQVDLLAAAAL